MAKHHKISIKRKKILPFIQLLIIVAIILLILLAGIFLYRYFISSKINSYLIKNDYYGFKLKTPKNWIAEEKTLYSEDNIAQFLAECKNDKSDDTSTYEIGVFRFKDQQYPQNFDISALGNFPAGLSSGAVLEITINCIPDNMKSKIVNLNYGDFKIDGEKTSEGSLDLVGFGKTKHLSFLHNDFQYKISEYVYISPNDKISSEEKLRENYTQVFDKIIYSFEFIK